MGSPETELGRGQGTERATAVTLTHAFELGQAELTWNQWSMVVPALPEKPQAVIESPETCTDPDCPLRYATWFEAVLFSNLLSERHDPPLPSCYVLQGCQGDIGRGMTCADVALTASTPYECKGFRLPTEAEWEYAARAGTRTAYYSGDINYTGDNVTDISAWDEPEPNLDPIAWYSRNSSNRTQPRERKRPNRWMLSDMLGNVAEWTSDQVTDRAESVGPLVDPATEFALTTQFPTDNRVTKGGNAAGSRALTRAAGRGVSPSDSHVMGIGIRLARTIDQP